MARICAEKLEEPPLPIWLIRAGGWFDSGAPTFQHPPHSFAPIPLPNASLVGQRNGGKGITDKDRNLRPYRKREKRDVPRSAPGRVSSVATL